jgi:hypothetical protein
MDQRVRNKLISIFIVHGCRILIGKFWVLQVAVRVESIGVLKDIRRSVSYVVRIALLHFSAT